MNKLFLIFSLLLSFPTYADWSQIDKNSLGDIVYLETDNFREHNGHVYYWVLLDYLKPRNGAMSQKILYELDCNVPRKQRYISVSNYNQPMGEGTSLATNNIESEWDAFHPPESTGAIEIVCNRDSLQ